MISTAKTVQEYLDGLPPDRRKEIDIVRKVIKKNLPKGYEEGVQYGMIGYYVPHSLYPAGYHCDPKQPIGYIALGSQKNYMVIHLMCVYGESPLSKWFQEAYKASGKKLDMGKACVRFKCAEDLALDVIGKVISKVPPETMIAKNEEARQRKSRKQ
jgi:hypothetical protein